MFDPHIGRWISEDPIGFEAGDENLNRYVGNEPVNRNDPSGLVETFLAPRGTEQKKQESVYVTRDTDAMGNEWQLALDDFLLFVYQPNKVIGGIGGSYQVPPKEGGVLDAGVFWARGDFQVGFTPANPQKYDRVDFIKLVDYNTPGVWPSYNVTHNDNVWGIWGLPLPRTGPIGEQVGAVQPGTSPFIEFTRQRSGFYYHSFQAGYTEHYKNTPVSPNVPKHDHWVFGAFGGCDPRSAPSVGLNWCS